MVRVLARVRARDLVKKERFGHVVVLYDAHGLGPEEIGAVCAHILPCTRGAVRTAPGYIYVYSYINIYTHTHTHTHTMIWFS